MALDRQRILSELGSVMNQLKSADCGCMRKLFRQSGQAASPQQNIAAQGVNVLFGQSGQAASPQQNIAAQGVNALFGQSGQAASPQQNIAAQGVNAVTHSEGKLTAPQVNQQQRQMAVERVGGDTVANNQMGDQRTDKDERVMGQIGDVPSAVKPIGDGKPNEMTPLINRNTRNGLQDMVYTSYPSSVAWTFHGANSRPYSPTRGRYRGRYR